MQNPRQIIITHLRRYPHMEVQDFLKLFYQNSFGPAHFSAPSSREVRAYLEGEYQAMTSSPACLEKIGHGYFRAHLGLVREGILTLDELALMFERSMSYSVESMEGKRRFDAQIKALLKMADEGCMPFSCRQVQTFVAHYKAEGLRPIPHSEPFKRRYAPHYRVVCEAVTDMLGTTLKRVIK